ncbi:MAG: hypothetical protein BZ137_03555 [Methanosphaera sp. rholeuAM130]|nr:MAG: hypothetical protein BZ137_03555 [Methanosphaera sp. rholeuAM130]
MNTKLILAIAIVALVGVVAATYQINNTNDLTNTYTDVEPELQVEAGAADSADSVIGGDSANTLPSNKNKENSKKSSSKTASKQKNKISSGSGSSGTSSGSGSAQNAGSQATIDAYSVARSAGIQMGATSTRYLSSFTVDGVVYNVYGQYKNGQLIGETEVNTKTGQITGGAWIGEVTGGNSGGTPDSGNTNSGSSSSDSGSSDSSSDSGPADTGNITIESE